MSTQFKLKSLHKLILIIIIEGDSIIEEQEEIMIEVGSPEINIDLDNPEIMKDIKKDEKQAVLRESTVQANQDE